METQEGPQPEPQAQAQPQPPQAPCYPPPYYPPPYYPPAYYAPPRNTMDMPLVALIVSLVGVVYWCPPFVLPGITLYLISKAKKEMAAGVPAGPSSDTYLNIARILAIVEMCLAGVIVLVYAAIIILAAVTS